MVHQQQHIPVLLQEVTGNWFTHKDGRYIDATFGRGGHSRALLAKLDKEALLLGIDKDFEAIEAAKLLAAEDKRFIWEHGSFADLGEIAKRHDWSGKVDGILLDLGMSSPQLDDARRGFSFLQDGPLDMRMDPRSGISAADWLNQAPEQEISRVLWELGEERYAKRIASRIIYERENKPFMTTKQLTDVIVKAMPRKEHHKHPATRSFQAIRIFINRELESLQACLMQCLDILAIAGRLLVISFHSLEDRIVKRFIHRQQYGEALPRHIPIRAEDFTSRMRSIGRAIKPSISEVSANPRARSAILRVAEKMS